MISFRDRVETVPAREQLLHVRRALQQRDAEAVLIELGALEQAMLDAFRPTSDGTGPVEQTLRHAMHAAGEVFVAQQDGRPLQPLLDRLRPIIDLLDLDQTPSPMQVKAPEGYVHYALDPAAYLAAARNYVRDVGPEHGARAVVLGVRSIGTSLSAVVASAVGSERSLTVRPHGESGSRRIAPEDSLSRLLVPWLQEGGDVLIVDEGPGATGETFYCIGEWLSRLGLAEDRMVLFPSHTGGMGLAPPERRVWFLRVRKYPPAHGDPRFESVVRTHGLSDIADFSGGLWRSAIPGSDGLPAATLHERRKYRALGSDGKRCMLRFAGVGHWGAEGVHRADMLSRHGLGPRLLGYERGYMLCEWIDGRPVSAAGQRNPQLLAALGRYLPIRLEHFRTGRTASISLVSAALRENAEEAMGANVPGLRESLTQLHALPEREAVIPDARLQRWEWIVSPAGYTKVDAFDHGDGLRLPGPADAAWDLAGAAVEYSLDDASVEHLVHSCEANAAARAGLRAAVAAYRAAYAACCLGEADLSMREAPDASDQACLRREVVRYRDMLRDELIRAAA